MPYALRLFCAGFLWGVFLAAASVIVMDMGIGIGTFVATVPVSAGPHGMVAHPDGRTLYVSGDGSSEVSVIDTMTDRVAARIDVGKTPHGLAMAPDGKLLLVAGYGEDHIAFVDTAKQSVIATVAVTKPHTIAIRPDGKVAYVSSEEPEKPALVVIDVSGRTVARRLPLEKVPRDLEFGHDSREIYFTMAGVNAVMVLDLRPRPETMLSSLLRNHHAVP
jgi:YVTN family beta-propeller protein